MQNKGNRPLQDSGYVLDSYAILAYLESELGSERVLSLLETAAAGKILLYMCVINLGEVMYIVERERGLSKAQEVLARIDELPIEIVNVERTLALAAAHLKTDCSLSYADCFAAALSQIKNAPLVTGDTEFRKVKPEHHLQIEWLANEE
jgi:predicted nucleic acid-binding protein